MKLSALALPLALAATPPSLAAAQAAAPAPTTAMPPSLKDPAAQAGYVLGYNLGLQMRNDGLAVDTTALQKGLSDAMSSSKPLLTDDQMRVVIAQFQAQVTAARQAKAGALAAANRAQGDAFLKANAAKPGVVSLPSGLQYQILKAGNGPRPKATDTVVCNYRGTLIDGTEFDSSYARNDPAEFPVSGVIPGWTQALQLMPVGSKWRLVLPASLAYGDKGALPKIGPGATLVFEVELVSIKGG